MFGTFSEIGLDDALCYDRRGRFGPYGYREDDEDHEAQISDTVDHSEFEKEREPRVQWENVNWGKLQDECLQNNAVRFESIGNQQAVLPIRMPGSGGGYKVQNELKVRNETSGREPKILRKAVIIRTWERQKYDSEVVQHLRSMIMELSLHTGSEYSVYLLVEVTDHSRHVEGSKEAYQKALKDFVPREFRNMALLFTPRLLESWYGHGDYDSASWLHSNQAIQLFSLHNPQFSHVWEIPLETRYTGNWYSLLSGSMDWARKQPRKLQWERAGKFYIPSHHGAYANFSSEVASQNPSGGIWGALSSKDIRFPRGPLPPRPLPAEDGFDWGVGEDADDIVPSALIDTVETTIFSEDKVKGLDNTPSRRALMVSPIKCVSDRLLGIMHDAQIDGVDMRPELFAHTMALLHGLKVVALPLPIYYNNDTSPQMADEIFNNPKPNSFFEGDSWTMPIKRMMSFWWQLDFASFPQLLYRKWYGVNGVGKRLKSGNSLLCLPEMLIYPIKNVVSH